GISPPNKKCCITGSFPSTSLSYIFNMPPLIFPQFLAPDTSSNMGECHRRSAVVLMLLINAMQPRYMYSFEYSSSISSLCIDLGRMWGCEYSCAEPKTKGRNW